MGLKKILGLKKSSVRRRKKSKTHPSIIITETPPQPRRKSIFNLISPSDVTEGSLQVWRGLPSKIRHDPSLASFQLENDRLHGEDPEEDDDNGIAEDVPEDSESIDQSEFITIKVTNEQGESEQSDAICAGGIHKEHGKNGDISHLNDAGNGGGTDEHKKSWKHKVKVIILCSTWLIFTGILARLGEKDVHFKQLAIPELGRLKNYILPELPTGSQMLISLDGPFISNVYENKTRDFLSVLIQIGSNPNYDTETKNPVKSFMNISEEWQLALLDSTTYDVAIPIKRKHLFDIDEDAVNKIRTNDSILQIQFKTNSSRDLGLRLEYDPSPIDMHFGVIFAAMILILLYVLIIWEIVHRTFAAIFASCSTIAVLAVFNNRPTMADIIEWMDMETLLLLFSMMILIAILTETGVFDRLAVYSFQITNGKIWPLFHCLCIVTALISSFLDNVTTILLMTPITIRLCEVLHLNPVPILMAIIVHANIGGTTTPVGDPPNIIITSNSYIAKHGVSFLTFTVHMAVGVLLVLIQSAIHLRIQYRDIHDLRLKESKELKELRREISVWERTAASLTSYSKDVDLVRETLLKKVKILRHKLKKTELVATASTEAYMATLEELKQSYPIKNKALLIKSGIALTLVITLFFIQSIPDLQTLSLGWCALLGVILLLIIANKDDMDSLMHRIEWTTLLFFAAMFVMMEGLARLGLINWIGRQTENIILSVGEDARLAVAIIIILWISAITSAFVDSIPVTAMMVKVVVSLAENETLGLPLQPLVWALAFGPCLGGNGTLYGASANVVCAGIAEQHGYKITFIEYIKACFPIMIGSVIVTTIYLMISHVLFQWH